MFFTEQGVPAPGTEQLLPELREYVKSRYVPAASGGCSLREESSFRPGDDSAAREFYLAWEKEHSVRKSFSSEVIRLMGLKYSKPSMFYRPAGIDKRTFHKIKTDYGYKPSKETAFRCCIGLRLDAEESENLLQLAGYAFSPSEPNDLILRFCLEKGIWDIPSINGLLSSFDLDYLEG